MERPVLLCGLGRVGWRVLDSLRAAGFPVVVIDVKAAPDDPRLAGVTVLTGDCRRHELLEQAGVARARGIVIVTSDDLVNISTALLARKLNPSARIVVRMFNQNLIARFGHAVKNTVALSVSALIAPVMALTAVTGGAVGAFHLDGGPRQVSELLVAEGSELAGKAVAELAREHAFIPLALVPATGPPLFLHALPGDRVIAPGDRLVVCGEPAALQTLLGRLRGDLLPGVRWAWSLRRWLRTARRTLLEVDLAVKIITPIVFAVVLGSTLVFRYGLDAGWADALYQTVSIIATGSDLRADTRPEWAKAFVSVLKLAGAALLAGFTAILTNYLIRARLKGALEVRHVPDGGHIVICGLGNVGYRLVQELTAMGERLVALDKLSDGQFHDTVRRMGVPVFVGDATVPEVLAQARADAAKAVIAATDSELANIEIALLVRETNPAQRVVVRLLDPDFAEAVREAANIRHAISAPALAAPAFASALYGDSVLGLFTAAGRTLVVVELVVNDADDHLNGRSVRALVLDYGLLPVALSGRNPADAPGHRLAVGDKLTVVAELPDYERLLRLQKPPAVHHVAADGAVPPDRPTDRLTFGEATALVEELARAGVPARVV